MLSQEWSLGHTFCESGLGTKTAYLSNQGIDGALDYRHKLRASGRYWFQAQDFFERVTGANFNCEIYVLWKVFQSWVCRSFYLICNLGL